MSALTVSVVVFAVVILGASLGAFLRGVLPKHHMSDESKDAVKLGIGLIVTLTALVLGLLVSAAKSSFDKKSAEIKESAAMIILLDRTLRQYGPETAQVRGLIRRAVVAKANLSWVENDIPPQEPATTGKPAEGSDIEDVQQIVSALAPTSNPQRALQSRALQLAGELAQTRWLLLEQRGSSIPIPFLVVVVFWLAVIFGGVGLLAPRNGTVYSVILVCALSVSGAIFLILELDQPFAGLMSISDGPVRSAIMELGR
jgi:hypothetical protein